MSSANLRRKLNKKRGPASKPAKGTRRHGKGLDLGAYNYPRSCHYWHIIKFNRFTVKQRGRR